MTRLHPKYFCILVPIFNVVAYLVLTGIDGISDSTWEKGFPLSTIFLIPFILAYSGGILFPLGTILWALTSMFLKFDGKRPTGSALFLIVISFISAGIFIDAIDSLTNLPNRANIK